MYCKYFGFSEDPFQLTPDPQFLFLDEVYREAMAHLEYGIETGKGFVLLSGEVGTGKTTLVHALLDRFREEVNTAFVFSTAMNFVELLKLIHDDFDTGVTGDSEAFLLIELNRYLLKQYREGKRCVLIFDEAQNLSVPLLEKIRMLSNLESRKSKLIQILLVGQPELAAKLQRNDLRQLRQRVAVRFHLPPMSRERADDYIAYRLARVGSAHRGLFEPEALERLYAESEGIPRVINVLCSNALLLGMGAATTSITADMIDEVIADLTRGVPEGPIPGSGDDVAGTIAHEAIHGGGRTERPWDGWEESRPLTAEEAAQYLRVSTKTMRAFFTKGVVPASKIGRGWRVLKADLDMYIRTSGQAQSPGGETEPATTFAEQWKKNVMTDEKRPHGNEPESKPETAKDTHEDTGHGGSGVHRQSHGEGTVERGLPSRHSG